MLLDLFLLSSFFLDKIQLFYDGFGEGCYRIPSFRGLKQVLSEAFIGQGYTPFDLESCLFRRTAGIETGCVLRPRPHQAFRISVHMDTARNTTERALFNTVW